MIDFLLIEIVLLVGVNSVLVRERSVFLLELFGLIIVISLFFLVLKFVFFSVWIIEGLDG